MEWLDVFDKVDGNVIFPNLFVEAEQLDPTLFTVQLKDEDRYICLLTSLIF
jgi:hypothetical protein